MFPTLASSLPFAGVSARPLHDLGLVLKSARSAFADQHEVLKGTPDKGNRDRRPCGGGHIIDARAANTSNTATGWARNARLATQPCRQASGRRARLVRRRYRDHFDLDPRAKGQRGDAYCGSSGERLAEMARINLVQRREVGHVDEEDVAFDDIVKGQVSRCQNSPQVA